MSIYVCDIHGRRVDGSLGALYLTVLNGGQRRSRKLRICAADWVLLRENELSNLVPGEEELSDIGLPPCLACGEAVSKLRPSASVFATVYSKGVERADLFGVVHYDCQEAFADHWELVEA